MPRLYHLVAGLGALGSLALGVHPHPSGSTDRVTPGTVRVEARSHVTINLLDDRGVIQQVVREYDTPVGSGSGFVVAPDGVVVTATGVVQSGKDPAVYAANRAFAEYFDVNIPADFSRHKLKDPGLNRRLQACYPPQGANSTCIITAATKVTVFPFADPPAPEGYPADLLHTGASAGAPAVLKMAKGGEDSTLPTVPLGASLGSGIESVDAIGTPVRPNAKTPPKVVTAHLDPPGGRTFKAAERGKLDDFLDDDGQGAAVIDDGKSEVIGMLAGGGGTAQTLTPVEDIRTALVAAGVTPAGVRWTWCTRRPWPPTTTSSTPTRCRCWSRCCACDPTTRSRRTTCGSRAPTAAPRRRRPVHPPRPPVSRHPTASPGPRWRSARPGWSSPPSSWRSPSLSPSAGAAAPPRRSRRSNR